MKQIKRRRRQDCPSAPSRVIRRICLAAGVLALTPSLALSQTLTIRNATVVGVVDGRLKPHTSVTIEGNRITRVAATLPPKATQGQVVDATGLYLIPGLWDMHTHAYSGETASFRIGSDLLLPLFIANGVTGIRDMGSNLDAVLRARGSIQEHQLVGPRIVLSGPMLDGPMSAYTAAIRVANPDDGRAAVRMLKERGVDFIKVQSGVPRDAYLAIADEAKQLHIPFEGHVPDAIRAKEAIELGQASFEHLLGVFEASSRDEDAFIAGAKKGPAVFLETWDLRRERAIVHALAQHHVWQCPTIASDLNSLIDFVQDPSLPYWPRDVVEGWRQWEMGRLNEADTIVEARRRFAEHEVDVIRKLHRAGVPFLAGTDAADGFDLVPGASLHRELEWFVTAGFTPLEALQTATINPSSFLNRSHDFGAVAAGKLADLVLLARNPLTDIRNTRSVVGVIADGRYYSTADLAQLRLQLIGVAAK